MTKNFAANLKIGALLGSSVNRVFGGLKNKIKDQEGTLKKLRAAYKEASKGTGEYAGKLDELQREIDQTERKLKSMRAAAKYDIGKGLSGVGSTFLGDAKRLAVGAGIVVGATAAVGGAVYTTTKSFVDWADDIGDSAEALQMSTQALQTWQFAAATVGVGGSKMTAGIAKFSKSIADGGTATEETLDKLGVNAKRLKKLSLDEQLEVIAEAFKDYKGTDRAALAMRLFGRSGYQLAGILAKGKKGLDEFRKAGEETGAVLDDDAAEAAGEAAAALDMFGITMVGLRNTIAIQFVPTLKRLVDRFTKFVRDNGPQIKKWAEDFANMIETKAVPAIGKLIDNLPGLISDFTKFAKKAWDITIAVKDFLGGWDKLGFALLAINFAPTILAVGNLAAGIGKLAWALYGLAPAWVAGMGPIAWAAAAAGSLFLVLSSIVDPGGPMDILGKVFPKTMEAIRNVLKNVCDWIDNRIEITSKKLYDMLPDWARGLVDYMSFDGVSSKPNYSLPKTPYGSILGNPPKGTGTIPLSLPQPDAPPATKEDLLEFLKPQSSNNTYNINVNAPGANGDDIAERIRRAFERKPLFDSDGALAPG
jgi:hypothetical protein